MKTPWSLHKMGITEPATGLLLFTSEAAELLSLYAAVEAPVAPLCPSDGRRTGSLACPPRPPDRQGCLSYDGLEKKSGQPRIHAVAGGFLLRLTRPTTQVYPGAIRLRELTSNLFLPADAELWPALFPDEAASLVRERGLVFLPGGRILAFDPERPVPLASLVSVRRLPRQEWRPLPEPAVLAEQLTEIILDRPEDSPEAVLETGGEDIGVEEPQAPEVGPGAAAGALVQRRIGQILGWLGRMVGSKALARHGREMVESARQTLQRLSERGLDRQEAALRELLRQFQQGKLDDALRRALPLGDPAGRGGKPTDSADLPRHNLRWSLSSIFGAGGPAGLWLGGAEVQAQLAAEYRKAAEAATARGDYRRAAFIYAKLLRDYRLAADVLAQGGLHHDAAILLLDKVGDVMAAAREFEAAGEVDRAVALYRQAEARIAAGDLLRKVGEEEQARAQFRLAIDRMRHTRQHHAAGELALQKLHDDAVAESCFREGWEQRQSGAALGCLLRLTQLLAERPAPTDLWALIDEAEPYLRREGSDSDAAAFYNELARLGDGRHLAASRAALRDRALLGLAARLRQRAGVEARSGSLVTTLLAQSNLWSAAQVSDAETAAKATLVDRKAQKKPAARRVVRQVRIHEGKVTAACAAADAGRLFVAFEDGALRCFEPATGSVKALLVSSGSFHSVVTDQQGEAIVGIRTGPSLKIVLVSYYLCINELSSAPPDQRVLIDFAASHLSPLVQIDHDSLLVVWNQEQAEIRRGPSLLPVERRSLREILWTGNSGLRDDPVMFGVFPIAAPEGIALLVLDDHSATLCLPGKSPPRGAALGWIAQPAPSSLSSQVIWPTVQGDRLYVEVVRVAGGDGHVCSSRLCVAGASVEMIGSAVSKTEGYLAAALVMPWRIAAVREGGIDWLRIHNRQLVVSETTEVNLGGAAGCFFSPPTSEVLVVCQDGYVVRVSVPQ